MSGFVPTIDREAVRRCHADGLSDRQAARVIGCTRESVGIIRRELGLKPKRSRGRPVVTATCRPRRGPSKLTDPAARERSAAKRRHQTPGWCVGCFEDATRDSVAGPVCDRCGRWVDEQQERIAWLLP